MREQDHPRAQAVQRLQEARDQRTSRATQYEAAAGSSAELPAFTELKAAEDQFAAREAWLEWIDKDY